MTYKKNTTNSGRTIVVWAIILAAIFYFVSSWNIFAKNRINTNNTNTTTRSNYSCPMMRNTQWWGWCGGSRKITAPASTAANAAVPASTYETIQIWHDEVSLLPETVKLTAGKSYKLAITPSADGGWCMNTMTFPGLDDTVYPVKKGETVTVTINNAKAGTYEVVCWAMGMHQWTIIIQ